MPSSLDLYTTGNMEYAIATAATSEATGFPKENLLDDNPSTSWKPSSTANNTVTFDLGETKAVAGLIIMIRNHTTDFNDGTASILMEGSSDGSSWSSAGGSVISFNEASGQALYFVGLNTLGARRYWRFTLQNMIAIIQISCAWWCQLAQITQGCLRPKNEVIRYSNRQGNGINVQGINRAAVTALELSYQFPNATNWTQLKNAFNDSYGRRFPLIAVPEGSASFASTAFLCRFRADEMPSNEEEYLRFHPSFALDPINFVRAGRTY